MALNNHDQAQMREYLLGKLSEAEQERIDERLIREEELFDQFEASKDELVEEYCAGGLGSGERQFFEEHFLSTTDGQERRTFVLAMNCLQQQRANVTEVKPAPVVNIEHRPTLFERLKALITTQRWAAATATSMVLVVAAVFIINALRPPATGQTFATTLQSYTQNRGAEGEQPTKIKLPPNTAFLKLILQFPKPVPTGTRYSALLDDRVNQKTINVVESDTQSATVVIPTDLISHGLYAVELSSISPDGNGPERSYRFFIE